MSNTQQPFAPPMSRGLGGLTVTVIAEGTDGKLSPGVSRSFNVNGTTISQNVLLNGVNHEVTLKGVTPDQIKKLKSGAASIVVDTDGNNGKIVENSFAGEPTRKHRLEDLWRMNVRLRDQLPLDLTKDPGFPKGYGFDDVPESFMIHITEYKNGVREVQPGETWTPSLEWLAAAKKRHGLGGRRGGRTRRRMKRTRKGKVAKCVPLTKNRKHTRV